MSTSRDGEPARVEALSDEAEVLFRVRGEGLTTYPGGGDPLHDAAQRLERRGEIVVKDDHGGAAYEWVSAT